MIKVLVKQNVLCIQFLKPLSTQANVILHWKSLKWSLKPHKIQFYFSHLQMVLLILIYWFQCHNLFHLIHLSNYSRHLWINIIFYIKLSFCECWFLYISKTEIICVCNMLICHHISLSSKWKYIILSHLVIL